MSGRAEGSHPRPSRGLSPLRSGDPRSAPPATPGALYRSCFAGECESIVLQLHGGGCGQGGLFPTPGGRASTVEEETLTPLESSWSFLADPPPGPSGEPPSPGPAPCNRTYDKEASCEWPSEGPPDDPCRTFEKLPGGGFLASTPLPPRGGFFPPTPQEEQQQQAASCPTGCHKAPPRDGARPAPAKAPPCRKSLAGVKPTGEAPSAPAVCRAKEKRNLRAAGPSLGRRESPRGAATQGQNMPGERNNLSKLSCSKKSSRPPSRISRAPGLLNGLSPSSVGRESKFSGSKLPVRAAGGNKGNQKHPLERRLAAKTSCPGKSHTDKPACGILLDAGQISSAAVLSRPAAPCSQCQQLAEENRRLKTMLEEYEKTITALKQEKEAK